MAIEVKHGSSPAAAAAAAYGGGQGQARQRAAIGGAQAATQLELQQNALKARYGVPEQALGSASQQLGWFAGPPPLSPAAENAKLQQEAAVAAQGRRREDFEYSLTAKQKAEDDKLVAALAEMEASDLYSADEKAEGRRRIREKRAGIQPLQRQRKELPPKEHFENTTYTNQEGITFSRKPDGSWGSAIHNPQVEKNKADAISQKVFADAMKYATDLETGLASEAKLKDYMRLWNAQNGQQQGAPVQAGGAEPVQATDHKAQALQAGAANAAIAAGGQPVAPVATLGSDGQPAITQAVVSERAAIAQAGVDEEAAKKAEAVAEERKRAAESYAAGNYTDLAGYLVNNLKTAHPDDIARAMEGLTGGTLRAETMDLEEIQDLNNATNQVGLATDEVKKFEAELKAAKSEAPFATRFGEEHEITRRLNKARERLGELTYRKDMIKGMVERLGGRDFKNKRNAVDQSKKDQGVARLDQLIAGQQQAPPPAPAPAPAPADVEPVQAPDPGVYRDGETYAGQYIPGSERPGTRKGSAKIRARDQAASRAREAQQSAGKKKAATGRDDPIYGTPPIEELLRKAGGGGSVAKATKPKGPVIPRAAGPSYGITPTDITKQSESEWEAGRRAREAVPHRASTRAANGVTKSKKEEEKKKKKKRKKSDGTYWSGKLSRG